MLHWNYIQNMYFFLLEEANQYLNIFLGILLTNVEWIIYNILFSLTGLLVLKLLSFFHKTAFALSSNIS